VAQAEMSTNLCPSAEEEAVNTFEQQGGQML